MVPSGLIWITSLSAHFAISLAKGVDVIKNVASYSLFDVRVCGRNNPEFSIRS